MKKICSLMVAAALCFAGNVWAAPIDIDSENPYVNGFDTETVDALPTGWTAIGTGDASVQSRSDLGNKTRGGSARALQIRANKGQTYAVILPEFSDPIANLTISFYPCKGSNNATYSVGYVKDDAYTKVADFDATTSFPAEAITCAFASAGAPEGALIAIEVKNTETSGSKKSSLIIDDVTVSTTSSAAPVTCAAPKNLKASDIKADAASLTWEKGDAETIYQVTCVLKGETPTWASETFITVSGLLTATLENLSANTAYDAYVRSFCDVEDLSAAVKVSFTTLAVEAPTALVATATGAKTATISWTVASGIDNYDYLVTTAAEADWSKAVLLAGHEVNLTDLTPNTVYNVFVRSHYSATAFSEAISGSFRTDCDKVAVDKPHPWSENFESETVDAAPACWEVIGSEVEFKVATGNYALDFEGQALVMNASNAAYGYILFPEFNADFENLQIQFAHKAEDAGKSGSIDFGFYKSDAFTLVKAIEPSTEKKTIDAISLASVPTDARLAFRYKSNTTDAYKYAVMVDDIVIEALPSCAVPTGLTVSEITANSAQVAWTSAAAGFALELKDVTAEGEWKAIDAVVTNPFSLTGLDEHNTYAVRVKAVCGSEDASDWTEPVEFSTVCAVKAFGYKEAFVADELPACWDNADVHGMNGWGISEGAARYTTTSNIANHATLVTPWIAVAAEGTPSLLFDWKNSGTTAQVSIEVEGNEPVVLADLSDVAEDLTTQKFFLTDHKGKNVRFLFYAASSAKSKYVCVDNFRVIEKPFLAPTALKAEAITKGAELTWTAGWDEAAWDLRYKKAADAEWTLVEALDVAHATLISLDPEAEYEAQVRAIYGEEKLSAWTESVLFTPEDGSEEAVELINAAENVQKTLINGQLIIIRDGVQFNAQGARVSK